MQPHDPTPQFATRRELLSHLYRKHGVRTWFGMARRMAYRQLTGQPALINSGTAVSFWAPAEEFIRMTQSAGLHLIRYWQCGHFNTRNNYLLHKPR